MKNYLLTSSRCPSLISPEASHETVLSIEFLAEYGVWKDYDLRARSFSLIFELLNGHSNESGFIALLPRVAEREGATLWRD